MKRAIAIQDELREIQTVESLTEVFESIASIKISRIRDRVVVSKDFFAELWQTYGGLRIDPKERLNRSKQAQKARDVFLAVTAEGKLSGDIDEKIIDAMLEARTSPDTTDIIVIGSHGVAQLAHRRVAATYAFHLPESDSQFSVTNVVSLLNKYNQISVFYQTYESLRVQKIKRIDLISAIHGLSKTVEQGEVVSSHDYIFEPNIDEIADYMESVMMSVAVIQVIMESKLAQHASRFNTMNAAKHRADELTGDFRRLYNRAKRGEADERLKEIMKVVNHQKETLA